MCGDNNLLSLRLKFEQGANGDVSASFKGNSRLQGYDGILHGGVISALLDSVMTNCLLQRSIEAVTADLRVRFLLPVPCNANLKLRAWIIEETRMLFKLKAELTLADTLMARAEALFVKGADTGDN
jgi:acyl-coenzyme A thioesterase PaaI-like protein